jgi:hypothetical protein
MNLSILFTIWLVVVVYIHIFFQLKTSDDLEIYEIQMPSKQKLEEVCNFKQPVVFNYTEETLMNCNVSSLQEYLAFDVYVWDEQHVKVPLPLEQAMELFKTKKYATMNNSEFLNETNEGLAGLDRQFLDLERNPENTEIVRYIFRVIHTIKGTCGFLGLDRLEKVAHATRP